LSAGITPDIATTSVLPWVPVASMILSAGAWWKEIGFRNVKTSVLLSVFVPTLLKLSEGFG